MTDLEAVLYLLSVFYVKSVLAHEIAPRSKLTIPKLAVSPCRSMFFLLLFFKRMILQALKTISCMSRRACFSTNSKLAQGECTLMRTISSGMFIMALVSQLSRLLAKLRMAWVKAPGSSKKKKKAVLFLFYFFFCSGISKVTPVLLADKGHGKYFCGSSAVLLQVPKTLNSVSD